MPGDCREEPEELTVVENGEESRIVVEGRNGCRRQYQ
jgi:hypothetical protein